MNLVTGSVEPSVALVFSPEVWVEELHRHLSHQYVLDDPDFTTLKADRRFTELLDQYLPAEVSLK